MELCTKEPVMVDDAMESHDNRFRTGDHSMASLAPLKETLFDFEHRCSCQTTRGEPWTESSKTPSFVSVGGDDDRCGVDRPTLSTS